MAGCISSGGSGGTVPGLTARVQQYLHYNGLEMLSQGTAPDPLP